MGIEALGSIGRIASIAPAVGRGIGSSLGRISGFPAPKMEGFSMKAISNPFLGVPKTPTSYIENRGPSLLGPKVEAIKNPFRVETVSVPKPQLRAVDVVRLPYPARGLDVRVITNPNLASKTEVAPQSIVQRKTESRLVNRVVQSEQVVEEKRVVTERKQDNEPQSKQSDKAVTLRFKIVEAVRVTEARKHAIVEAIKRTKEKTGSIHVKGVLEFLSVEFWKYISPLVGKSGKDGTINLTLRAIANNSITYNSVEEAQRGLSRLVEEHIPLEKGEGSRVATLEEVREVLEGKEKESLKSQAPAEIVIKRVVRKNVNTVVAEKEEITGEATLKSLGLEELFQKVA